MRQGTCSPSNPVDTQYFSNEQIVLQNYSCIFKIEPRIAWMEFAWVSITQVAEKIHLPLAVWKECHIQFVCVETGHRSAVESKSACRQDEVCRLE